MLQTLLSSEECVALDALLTETDELYTITLLKRQPKDFSLGEMRREMARGESPRPTLHLWPDGSCHNLDISREGITYYSSLVSYYSVFRLKQLDTWTHLPLPVVLCRPSLSAFQRPSAHLFHSSGEAVLRRSESHSQREQCMSTVGPVITDLPKAGEVLKLFTAE